MSLLFQFVIISDVPSERLAQQQPHRLSHHIDSVVVFLPVMLHSLTAWSYHLARWSSEHHPFHCPVKI